MYKKSVIIAILLFCSTSLWSQDSSGIPKTLSLQQCIDLAIQHNLQVKEAQFQSEIAKSNWSQAKGNLLPYINADITHGINDGRSIDPFSNGYVDQNVGFANYGLNANFLLWNGNSARNNAKQAALNYEAGKMDWQQQKDNITISVILAYLQEQSVAEQLEAARQQVLVTRSQEDRLKILNDQGATSPASYYDLKGQRASDELNVINLENSLQNARLALTQLMNISYDTAIQFQKLTTSGLPSLYGANMQDIFQLATQKLAMVQAANFKKSAAEYDVKAAKGAMLPSLYLNGGLGTNYSSIATRSYLTGISDMETDQYVLIDNVKVPVIAPVSSYASQKISYGDQWKNNFNSFISIGLRIPILQGLQAKNRVQQAKINLEKLSFQASSVQIELRREIEQAYMNMQASFKRLAKLNEQVSDFGESFRIAEIKFNEGAITSVDYLIARNNVMQAQNNLIIAKYDYLLRTKILDFYQGSLTF